MSIISIIPERTGRLLSIYLIVTLLTCQSALKLHNTMWVLVQKKKVIMQVGTKTNLGIEEHRGKNNALFRKYV